MTEAVREFDLTPGIRVRLTPRQLGAVVSATVALVLAVAAVLPAVLPKKYTIATEDYVSKAVEAQAAVSTQAVTEQKMAVAEVKDQVSAIVVKVDTLVDTQQKSRASQEAERVTNRIKDSTHRLREYQRIYEAGLRNLKADREPLEGVRTFE